MAMINTFRKRLYEFASELKDPAGTPRGLQASLTLNFFFQVKNSAVTPIPVKIPFEAFKLEGRVTKFAPEVGSGIETGVEITFDNAPLNHRHYLTQYVVAAVNDGDPAMTTWCDFSWNPYHCFTVSWFTR